MATITSTGTNAWNTNTAWVGGVQPTAADDVIIASAITIPTGTTVLGRSLTVNAGATLVFASTTAVLTLGDAGAGAGNVAINISATATITLTGIGTINLISTSATVQTIATGGKTLPSININGAGSSYQLSSALTSTGTFTLTSGTFSTNNLAFTTSSLTLVATALARTLTLGSSTVTVTGGSTCISATSSTALTITANTAVITCTSSSISPNMVVNWNGASLVLPGSTVTLSNGGGTWANVTRTGTATKTDTLTITGGATLNVTGTFTANGNSIINRLIIQSNITGTAATINAAAASITHADFCDINIPGTASTVIASDSFNRANGSLAGSTSDSAAGGSGLVWGSPSNSGNWNISSNQLSVTAPVLTTSIITLPAASASVRVEAKFVQYGGSGNSAIGMVVRYTDANNYAYLTSDQSGAIRFGQVVAGVVTLSANLFTIVANDVVALDVYGNSAVLRKNGVSQSAQIISSTLTGASVGLFVTHSTTQIFDDFKVTSLTGIVSGSYFGDCGGNSGITFTPGVTQTNSGVTGNWSDATKWTSRVPLPQDDVIVNTGSGNITLDMPRVGDNVDFTGFNGTLTWTTALAQKFYGSVTFASAMTFVFGNTVNWTLAGRGNHTFTAAKTFSGTNLSLTVDCFGGKYTLQDDYLATAHALSINSGELDTNSKTLTINSFASTGTIARALTFGTSIINLAILSGACWNVTSTGMTASMASSSIIISTVSASTRTFTGGGLTYGTLTYVLSGSTGQLTLNGNNNFYKLSFKDATNARSLILTAGTYSKVEILDVIGTSGKLMSIVSGTAGTPAYLALTDAPSVVDYLSIQDIYGSLPYKFYAGANSVDVSGNRAIIFTTVPTQPFVRQTAPNAATASAASISNSFSKAPLPGSVILYEWVCISPPGTITAPSGFTLAQSSIQGTFSYLYVWYKISDGTESTVSHSWVTARLSSVRMTEITGWTGTPTLDVVDSNTTSGAVLTLSTGSGVTNSAVPAYALADLSGNGNLGPSTSAPTNGFHEDLTGLTGTSINFKTAGKPLLVTGSQTTTFTWSQSRTPVATMVVFVDSPVVVSKRFLSMLGVGS